MNPSAREVLEAQIDECENCAPWGEVGTYTSCCQHHRDIAFFIELAERADLDIVEAWAKRFHEVYEEECHNNGWDSRTPVGWDDLPAANRKTTLATVGRILTELAHAAFPEVKEGE